MLVNTGVAFYKQHLLFWNPCASANVKVFSSLVQPEIRSVLMVLNPINYHYHWRLSFAIAFVAASNLIGRFTFFRLPSSRAIENWKVKSGRVDQASRTHNSVPQLWEVPEWKPRNGRWKDVNYWHQLEVPSGLSWGNATEHRDWLSGVHNELLRLHGLGNVSWPECVGCCTLCSGHFQWSERIALHWSLTCSGTAGHTGHCLGEVWTAHWHTDSLLIAKLLINSFSEC